MLPKEKELSCRFGRCRKEATAQGAWADPPSQAEQALQVRNWVHAHTCPNQAEQAAEESDCRQRNQGKQRTFHQ